MRGVRVVHSASVSCGQRADMGFCCPSRVMRDTFYSSAAGSSLVAAAVGMTIVSSVCLFPVVS